MNTRELRLTLLPLTLTQRNEIVRCNLLQCTKPYAENYKMLVKEIKDLNKLKDIPY